MQHYLQPYKAHFSVLGLISFWALAATTALTAYKAFYQPIKEIAPSWVCDPAIGAVVLVIYFLVDHGLSSNIANYLRHKYSLKQLPKTQRRSQNGLLNFIFIMLLARIVATGTASIWAGDEIGAWMHQGDPTAQYMEKIESNALLSNEKSGQAKEEYEKLQASEAERISLATRKGNDLISRAVKSGNIHQVSMYKSNPGFFFPPPQGQYYASNKSYSDRISAAKIKAGAMIEAELATTQSAKALFYGVASDSTTASINQTLGKLAKMKADDAAKAQRRHTNIIKGLDWCFLFVGLFSTIIVVRIERATGEVHQEKDFGMLFYMMAAKWYYNLYAWMEDFLNIDLDGNGLIGQVDNPNELESNIPVAFKVPPTQPHPTGVQWITPYVSETPPPTERAIVKGFAGRSNPTPPQAVEMPAETLVNTSKSLANVSPEKELEIKARQCIAAFKKARGDWHAWKGHKANSAKESAKANAAQHMLELEQEMMYNLECLEILAVNKGDLEIPTE